MQACEVEKEKEALVVVSGLVLNLQGNMKRSHRAETMDFDN